MEILAKAVTQISTPLIGLGVDSGTVIQYRYDLLEELLRNDTFTDLFEALSKLKRGLTGDKKDPVDVEDLEDPIDVEDLDVEDK